MKKWFSRPTTPPAIQTPLSHDTGKCTPPQLQPDRLVLDLLTWQGWKAELTLALIIYPDGLPVHRESSIRVVTA